MASPDAAHAEIDAALASWRQGDCTLGDMWFLARADPACPLTPESQEGADAETGNYEASVPGLAVLTQTCDLVRGCAARPFVEVAPLVELTADVWQAARRGRQPRYAPIPTLANALLAADLDRVMTVEKAVVAGWTRVAGCPTDDDARAFAQALARKRARVAFPDDFVALIQQLQKRLIDKHDKQSDEGAALRALREIRVQAAPSWEAPDVEILLLFIRDSGDHGFGGQPWDRWLDAWLRLVPPDGRFQVDGLVQTLEDLTAADYVGSDPLDLHHLSSHSA